MGQTNTGCDQKMMSGNQGKNPDSYCDERWKPPSGGSCQHNFLVSMQSLLFMRKGISQILGIILRIQVDHRRRRALNDMVLPLPVSDIPKGF
uniref:Uncharacterized protein n=1 Tax=Heterorhabditis bacteriophora TaxID=37862 RepID=A0A1I7XUB1_HETBA